MRHNDIANSYSRNTATCAIFIISDQKLSFEEYLIIEKRHICVWINGRNWVFPDTLFLRMIRGFCFKGKAKWSEVNIWRSEDLLELPAAK